jgi:hypothetical protein
MTGSGLGSLLGMRHALEPDHLAAVSTIVAGERNPLRAAWVGACWGVGHTATLIIAAAVLLALRSEMPLGAATGFELLVAVTLVGLGLRAGRDAVRQGGEGPARLHHHGVVVHAHSGVPAHVHIGHWTLARRPLFIGAVHGLAGSGALTALVLATLPSTAARLGYVALFGLGSTLGMAALSGLLGWPLRQLANRPTLARSVSVTVGCGSIVLGMWWGWRLL